MAGRIEVMVRLELAMKLNKTVLWLVINTHLKSKH